MISCKPAHRETIPILDHLGDLVARVDVNQRKRNVTANGPEECKDSGVRARQAGPPRPPWKGGYAASAPRTRNSRGRVRRSLSSSPKKPTAYGRAHPGTTPTSYSSSMLAPSNRNHCTASPVRRSITSAPHHGLTPFAFRLSSSSRPVNVLFLRVADNPTIA